MASMLPEDYADYRHGVVFKAMHTPVGVFEAWAMANFRYPGWPLSKRLELAEHVIQDIATHELAHVYWGSWIEPTQMEPIASAALPEVLRTWDVWVAKAGTLLVWFTISEEPDLVSS